MKAILAECLVFDSTRRLAPFRLTIYTLIVPFVNEDNSLGLLEGYFLDVRPDASADEVGRFLLLLRVGLVMAVCALFLSLGASVVFCIAMAIEALAVSKALLDVNIGFST